MRDRDHAGDDVLGHDDGQLDLAVQRGDPHPYVSGIIGTPTQAVEDELEHVVSALVRLGLLDVR